MQLAPFLFFFFFSFFFFFLLATLVYFVIKSARDQHAQRRLHTRLCFMYKIVRGLLYFPPNVTWLYIPSRALSHNSRLYLLHQSTVCTNYHYSTESKRNVTGFCCFLPFIYFLSIQSFFVYLVIGYTVY